MEGFARGRSKLVFFFGGGGVDGMGEGGGFWGEGLSVGQ